MHNQARKMSKIKDRATHLHERSKSVLYKANAILNHVKMKAQVQRTLDHIGKVRRRKK